MNGPPPQPTLPAVSHAISSSSLDRPAAMSALPKMDMDEQRRE